jgi:hypothetical protein
MISVRETAAMGRSMMKTRERHDLLEIFVEIVAIGGTATHARAVSLRDM